MPVVMYMEWDGVTPEQYDQARTKVDWETEAPDGAILHVPWFVDSGLRVVDLWDSADHFQRFVDARLMPAVQEIGIAGEPRVAFNPLHSRAFAPAIEKATAR
jgi:hypothetical protein